MKVRHIVSLLTNKSAQNQTEGDILSLKCVLFFHKWTIIFEMIINTNLNLQFASGHNANGSLVYLE